LPNFITDSVCNPEFSKNLCDAFQIDNQPDNPVTDLVIVVIPLVSVVPSEEWTSALVHVLQVAVVAAVLEPVLPATVNAVRALAKAGTPLALKQDGKKGIEESVIVE
jgi:hypothetical protein